MSNRDLVEVRELLKRELVRLLDDPALSLDDVGPESSLVHDLGLDSLKFVDLTLAIEDAFGLTEFPMQEWVDHEAEKAPPAFTVAALAQACLSELETNQGRRASS